MKDRIHTAACGSDPVAVLAGLLSKLRQLNLHIESADEREGEILIRYLSLLVNWILWRCWSDKLLFRVREADGGKSIVDVFAVPDLLRGFAAKDEQVLDTRDLISRLMIEEL